MAKIQDKIGAIRTVLAVVLVGFMPRLTPAQEHTTTVQQEIARHEQSLAEARAANHMREAAVELNFLGSLYRQAGRPEKSLEDYNQALTIEHDAGNRGAEDLTKTNMARVYVDLGQEQRAFDLLIPTLADWPRWAIAAAKPWRWITWAWPTPTWRRKTRLWRTSTKRSRSFARQAGA